MTAPRWSAAFAVALTLTTAQLLVVGWLNRARAHPESAPRTRTRPVLVKPVQREALQPVLAPSTTLETAPAPMAPTAALEPSAVPDLGSLHRPFNHMSFLPGLEGGLGLGGVAGTEDAEPDTPPRAVSRPIPRYPAQARRRGIEGHVLVRLRLDATGRVTDAVVVSAEPPGVFDDVALQTARRYRFEPARSKGTAVPTTLEQRIVFRLRK